ncbi:MAG: cell division protein ZapB [Spirochaetales bacterium]|nr:cell division protein ZapB [Spirochaetales bacterium]
MISLEQVKQLETRVHSAVARIRSLTTENTTLKENLSSYELRIDELEKLVSAFKSEQQEIEAGIIAALSQLDGLEDTVADTGADLPQEQPPEQPAEQSETPADPPAAPPEIEDAPENRDDAEPEAPAEDESAPGDELMAADASSDDSTDTQPDVEEPELDIF